MIHFDLPKQKSSIIKVLGVGGGGSNAVNYMYGQEIEGVDFIICNTDAKALEQSKIPNKIQLGPHLTQGLGAGANPEVGKQATEESLEEIKRILEVNTRMAFICAGMGGGTGTGGAPIIAKICRELGILTVGIVTTPFPFEGPRRIAQAEHGIRQLEPFVDTLLVISNDKLRMQYGNLKMRDAFGKADNILATAAKCITDIINSRGHIIVDFADVCTVMKNGGVAILGSSAVGGENRAQRAIEEALNSPLLNDNDIRGAKWILININSAEGDNECTMDELEIINNHLRSQAGEFSDVIVGMGYDNNLDDKIGITLIATGFEQKDPFAKIEPQKKAEPKPEKIVMTLGVEGEEKKQYTNGTQQPAKPANPLMPTLSENSPEPFVKAAPGVVEEQEESMVLHFDFIEPQAPTLPQPKEEEPLPYRMEYTEKPTVQPQPAANTHASSFLHRPSNIYTETAKPQPVMQQQEAPKQQPYVQQPQAPKPAAFTPPQPEVQRPSYTPPPQPEAKPAFAPQQPKQQEPAEEETPMMELVIKETTPATPPAPQPPVAHPHYGMSNEEDEKRIRAQERLAKLRNLSYNMSSPEVSNEFDNVPAYVRRNMELFGSSLASAENYYSKVTVNKDDNNETQLSTLNTFLDGKKPD
jgi:cell division protein FtsZ